MNNSVSEKIQEICKDFRIQGTYQSYEEIKLGNINKTYKVKYLREDGTEKEYMVQAVNTYVFKNPVQVMENIDKVTEHIREKDPTRTNLHFHHTEDRKTYVFDEDGFWRLFNYIPSTTYNVCDNLEVVRNAGRAFGEFQMMLSDFNAEDLFETIPNFHNTKDRYDKLMKAIEEDAAGRVKEVQEEIDWLISVREKACRLTDMYEKGQLPLRVTHNDTKVNNVLFELDGTEAIVVIDLDTVMPGLVGHDFGDAIRFAANYVEEDCKDYDKSGVNMKVFREFTDGFLQYTAATLTQNEIDTLALSCFALTVELCVRFLDDYIQGDPYFKLNYPEHNLVRTRCQIALAKDMEKKLDEMEDIVKECAAKYRA